MKQTTKLILETIGMTIFVIFVAFVSGLSMGRNEQIKVSTPVTVYVTNSIPEVKVTVTNTFNVLIVPSGELATPDDSTPDDTNSNFNVQGQGV